MLDPKRLCAGRINVVPVGDQDDVIIDPGFKNALYVVTRDRWKNRTNRCSAAIYGKNIGTCSSDRPRLLALPPLLRAFSVKIAFPLAAFQDISFISLDNAF